MWNEFGSQRRQICLKSLKINRQILQKSTKMVPKSSKIEPGGLQNVVEKFNKFLEGPKSLGGMSIMNFMIFSDFGSHFGAPNPSKIEKNREKVMLKIRVVFCIDFFMVWAWFLRGFWEAFSRQFFFLSLDSEFVKKLTKPRPWRQNQGSTFLKVIKNIEKNAKNY